MKKLYCYTKKPSLMYLILIFMSIIIEVIIPIFYFEKEENVLIVLIWIGIILFSISTLAFSFFHFRQYIIIHDEKIILRTSLYIIKEMKIKDCYYEVVELSKQYNGAYNFDYWICIYSYNETSSFKFGFENGKKYERIQLVYSEENINFIKKHIKEK